jgi:fructokinase
MNEVFCIGELLIDFVAANQGPDLSRALEFTKKAGGAPANVACAVAKLGGKSYFIGCVGKDPLGTYLLRTLEENNVNTTLSQRNNESFTTLAFVSLSSNGERDFVFCRGADKELKYDRAIQSRFPGNIVHFGAATSLLGGPLEETYYHYLFDAFAREAFITFDPNYREDLWKDHKGDFIRKCLPYVEKAHLCKFSEEEALLLGESKDLETACNNFHQMGATVVIVTLGEEGSLVSCNGMKRVVESYKVNPVDTTGAGDSFIGCLLFQIASLEHPRSVLGDFDLLLEMVSKANKAGAITTTQFGAIDALPGPDAIGL